MLIYHWLAQPSSEKLPPCSTGEEIWRATARKYAESERPLSLHQFSAIRALPAEEGVERGHQEIKGLLSTLG